MQTTLFSFFRPKTSPDSCEPEEKKRPPPERTSESEGEDRSKRERKEVSVPAAIASPNKRTAPATLLNALSLFSLLNFFFTFVPFNNDS